MFIPLGTDAPIYHRPFCTIGLIAANVFAFYLTAGGSHFEGWILQPGHFHPTEWISAAFLHFGYTHLVGNMLFLWIFGLVVEGKLGWWKFLTLYLVLCLFGGMFAQLVMLGDAGRFDGAGGASGVIYSLMAISLIWAPKNCVDILVVWFGRASSRMAHRFDVTILVFALYYIGCDFFVAWKFVGFEVSTPVLHLIGASVGFPIGILMLKKGWVECEGWDLFSVMSGRQPESTAPEPYRHRGPVSSLVEEIAQEQRRQCNPKRELRKISRMIDKGQIKLASMRYRQLRELNSSARLDESKLRVLIEKLREYEEWSDAVRFLEEYIESFPQNSSRARLVQASLLVTELKRPKAALKALEPIDIHSLSQKQQRHFHSIQHNARQQIDDGVLELDGLVFAEH